jgi:hypothetical protein
VNDVESPTAGDGGFTTEGPKKARPLEAWLLLAFSVFLIGAGIILRDVSTVTSKRVEREAARETSTTTSGPFSDALLIALLGLGGVCFFGWAFYEKVGEVSFLGSSVKMRAYARNQRIAAEKVGLQLERDLPEGAPDAVRLAAKATAATTFAIARTVELAQSDTGQLREWPDGAPAVLGGWDDIAEHALREGLRKVGLETPPPAGGEEGAPS